MLVIMVVGVVPMRVGVIVMCVIMPLIIGVESEHANVLIVATAAGQAHDSTSSSTDKNPELTARDQIDVGAAAWAEHDEVVKREIAGRRFGSARPPVFARSPASSLPAMCRQ